MTYKDQCEQLANEVIERQKALAPNSNFRLTGMESITMKALLVGLIQVLSEHGLTHLHNEPIKNGCPKYGSNMDQCKEPNCITCPEL